MKYVDSIKPYLEWQSDTAYLKNPPADQYFYPPHDVYGRIASIESKLKSDLYVNEYAFQQDLYYVFGPAHDGHFLVYPDLITKALQWGRKISLVSISKDGVEIPKIYSYSECRILIFSFLSTMSTQAMNEMEYNTNARDSSILLHDGVKVPLAGAVLFPVC